MIPRDAEYFAGDADEEYYICERGLVLEARFFDAGEPVMDKAIWPTVQGNRAYIRIRRKGLDKKFQLTRILADLFPEMCLSEMVIDTRKGPWPLSGETGKRGRGEAAPRDKARAHSGKAAAGAEKGAGAAEAGRRGDRPGRSARSERTGKDVQDDLEGREVDAPLESRDEDEDDDLIPESREVRTCKVCNLKKRVQEFSPRDDMCMDCYMGRDELLKEIMAKKRRKAKVFQPRIVEEGDDSGMGDGVDGLDRIEYGISVSD